MRAIRVHQSGGAEVLKLEDVTEPEPGSGELVIDVEAVGLNFIETYQRAGVYPMQHPYTPGSEAGGIVRAVGDGVSEFSVGDRVVTHGAKGAYAHRAIVPADLAVHIPDGVTTRTAVAMWLQGLTAHYLATSTFALQPGHRCLVHAAAGGVGLLLCQIAKRRGAFVIGTASTEMKRELAREAGADATIDYTSASVPDEVRRLTDGAGVHVVFDSVGRSTFEGSIDALAPRGLLALFGQSSGAVPPVDPQLLARKGSLFMTRPTLAHYVATRRELLGRASDLFTWFEAGQLSVRVGAKFPLDRADDAHRALEGRGTTGKVLLTPG